MIDYYIEFLEGDIKKGNRNNMFFRALLTGLASQRDINPLIKKAKELGLDDCEINATIKSAKRIDTSNLNLYSRWYRQIDNTTYINDFGDIFSCDELIEQFRYQISTMFEEGELILLASLSKEDKDLIKRTITVYSKEELLDPNFVIPNSAVIKVNPVKDRVSSGKTEDITKFRYVLIESDQLELEEQFKIYNSSIAPIDFLVYSGNRSIHAFCRVDAENIDEYKYRANKLADYFVQNGLVIDKAVLHPAAFGRLAGSLRHTTPQCLYKIEKKISYDVFEKEFLNTRVSKIHTLKQVRNIVSIKSSPVLIEGILRENSVMVLAGEPKIGKTMLLLQLAGAFSTGGEWLNRRVRCKKCLFVNLEVDPSIIIDRIDDISKYMALNEDNIYLANLRGCELNYEDLIKAIVNNTVDGVDVIMIDPIYKLFGGDENSPKEVIRLISLIDEHFLRKGKTVIFTHHYNKANTSKSINRVSGSSVFTRYPEAVLGLSKLNKNEILINYHLRSFESPADEIYKFKYPLYVFDRKINK